MANHHTVSMKPIQRIFDNVLLEGKDGCWKWLSAFDAKGYGVLNFRGSHWKAHRFSHTIFNGEIIDNLHVLHSCDNRYCVNPAHLRLGTNRDNVSDMVSRKRNCFGEKNAMTKLTVEQARFIKNSPSSTYRLAKTFGVTSGTISAIKTNRSWKHV